MSFLGQIVAMAARWVTPAASNLLLRLNERAGRAYVTESLAGAVRVACRINENGWAPTFGYWDAGESPGLVHAAQRAAIEAAADPRYRAPEVSLKLPALGGDPSRFLDLAADAHERRVRVHVDSLGPDQAGAAFSCLERAAAIGYRVGCTLPARWARSRLGDARRAIELGLPVRVVKGQWPDCAEGPSPDSASPDAASAEAFLAVVEAVAGRVPRVGLATHDPRLLASALQILAAADTPATVELLIGLPVRRPLRVAAAARVGVRVYIPFGTPSQVFGSADLRADPRRLGWLLSRALTPREWWLPGAPLNARRLERKLPPS